MAGILQSKIDHKYLPAKEKPWPSAQCVPTKVQVTCGPPPPGLLELQLRVRMEEQQFQDQLHPFATCSKLSTDKDKGDIREDKGSKIHLP